MNWKDRKVCGDLSADLDGSTITMMGWIDSIRDHGQVLFAHLRDVTGIVQVVFNPDEPGIDFNDAESLRSEYCIRVSGVLNKRSPETINPNIQNGDVELIANELEIYSASKTPPYVITEKSLVDDGVDAITVDEDLRLKHRYLDIRRPSIQRNLIKRGQAMKIIRDHLVDNGFHDIETPVLTKSTPEGARDYLVPSRVHEGKFYALPQSPQLFKQLLMIGGMEKYFQIVKCFRDEDLRPNRQPEFTQVDIEASFIDEEYIYDLIEGLIIKLFATEGVTFDPKFERLTYDEAMSTYGTDAPDLRFGMPFVDATDIFPDSDYKILASISSSGGLIKGINIKGQAEHLSKNLLQNEFAKKLIPKLGGKGMTWMKVENGELQSNIVQFFTDDQKAEIIRRFEGEDGDVIILIADTDRSLVHDVLGRFRLHIAERQNMIDPDAFVVCWITDYPMFEEKDGNITPIHHPFTRPTRDIQSISDRTELLDLKAHAYDIVVNGQEIGGGSLRIYDPNDQQKVFDLLGLTPDEIEEKFGFFVRALEYGTPPHGGIALGLDRIMSILLKTNSIRDVIAFPKNRTAHCPLTDAPSRVAPDQLDDLHLLIDPSVDLGDG